MVRPVGLPPGPPRFPTEYIVWLETTHGVKIDKPTRYHYDVVCHAAKTAFEECPLWRDLTAGLPDYDKEYKAKTEFDLVSDYAVEIFTKPFDSFLLKTYRRNISNNSSWPDPPDQGWCLPDSWFSRVNDVIRTTLTVNYLDGIQFLVSKATELAEARGTKLSSHFEARQEGYYAAHLYYDKVVEIPRRDFHTQEINMTFEIQVSTRIKQLIKSLLHKHYEDNRVRLVKGSRSWQWDYKSDEFLANYLGHILHYVEGMLVDLRDRQKEGRR